MNKSILSVFLMNFLSKDQQVDPIHLQTFVIDFFKFFEHGFVQFL